MSETATWEQRPHIVPPRSRVITAIGVLMMISAITALPFEIWGFMRINPANSESIFQMFDKQGFHPQWLSADIITRGNYILYSVFTVVDILVLLSAVALLKRQAWARIFFVFYFLVLVLRDLILITVFMVGWYLGKGLNEHENISHTLSTVSIGLVATMAVNMLFYIFCLFLFTSNKVQAEFNAR